MDETLKDKLTKTPEERRLYEQERATLEVTEAICELMEKLGISREEVANRLGWYGYALDHMLDGDLKARLCDLSELFFALGHRLHFSVEPLEDA